MSGSARVMIDLLVVDNDLAFINDLTSRLKGEKDFRLTHIVDSVFDAVELVRHEQPNVVLMSNRLPDGDGLEAAKYIVRCDFATSVLLMTDHVTHDVLTRALEEGCAGLVTRDLPLELIINALRDAAKGDIVFKFRELPAYVTFLQHFDDPVGAGLTTREREVLQCLLKGESTSTISDQLFISTSTVRNHVNSILTKMGAHSKLEAVTMAQRERLFS